MIAPGIGLVVGASRVTMTFVRSCVSSRVLGPFQSAWAARVPRSRGIRALALESLSSARLTPTAQLADGQEALLVFDGINLDEVTALAKGPSERTREALAALLASAASV